MPVNKNTSQKKIKKINEIPAPTIRKDRDDTEIARFYLKGILYYFNSSFLVFIIGLDVFKNSGGIQKRNTTPCGKCDEMNVHIKDIYPSSDLDLLFRGT